MGKRFGCDLLISNGVSNVALIGLILAGGNINRGDFVLGRDMVDNNLIIIGENEETYTLLGNGIIL